MNEKLKEELKKRFDAEDKNCSKTIKKVFVDMVDDKQWARITLKHADHSLRYLFDLFWNHKKETDLEFREHLQKMQKYQEKVSEGPLDPDICQEMSGKLKVLLK